MQRSRTKQARILMLLENNPYPQDPRVSREADALAAAGYAVTMIAPADPGQPWRETVSGVRVYRFPAPPAAQGVVGYLWEYGYTLAAMFLLALLVYCRSGFDVVHAANPPDTLVFIGAFYKLLGKRFIFDHHDLAPEMYYARFGGRGNRVLYRLLVGLERLSCALADHVIATNESYKAVEMARDRVPAERITIVRNGPDPARVRLVPPDPDLRQRAPALIGYVGRMGYQDGVDYLLRALHHLVHDRGRTDFYCVLVGKGDAHAGLQALCTQLGLDPYVWFTGVISDDDLRRYLSTVDICVDPDPSNPFNDRSTMIKMMEYMALGKPVVAFDLPEHRFTAQDAAVYVPPNGERAFAAALSALMDDPARRAALGACGRRRVATVLAWPHSAAHLLAAYRQTLRRRRGRQVAPAAPTP